MPIGFAGGLEDEHTGLVRFGFRDYDPDTGRFTARDPLGYAAGGPDLYGYCLDDPINFSDPMGLWSVGGLFDFFKANKEQEEREKRTDEVEQDFLERYKNFDMKGQGSATDVLDAADDMLESTDESVVKGGAEVGGKGTGIVYKKLPKPTR